MKTKFANTVVVLALGAIFAPAAAAADASLYGSIRLSLLYSDTGEQTGNTDDLELADESSRVGLQGNQQLGALTAFGRWEWGVDASTQDSTLGTRLGYVGLSGDFGTISFGSQWSAWNTYIGEEHTNMVDEGSWQNGTERNGDTLKYAGKFGLLSVEADVIVAGKQEEDANGNILPLNTPRQNSGLLDEVQVALGYTVGPVVLQAGLISRDGGADGYLGGGTLVGARVTYNRGPLVLSAAVAQDDDEFGGAEETTGIKLRAGYKTGPNRFLAVVTQTDNDVAGNSPGAIAIGYQYDLSKRSRVALEIASVDPDIAGPDSSIEGGVMFRHDW